MKITCLIVEDEPNAIKLVEKYIGQLDFLQLKGICSDGEEALSRLSKETVDLVFMDINLPQISGMEISRILSAQNVIFTTAYSEFAVDSYEANAVDYLVKPFSFERFCRAVMKARQLIEFRKNPGVDREFSADLLFLKSGKKMIPVAYSDILYIEGSKEYVTVRTIKGDHLVYKRMKELENKLPENFVRVHNSFIINLTAIHKIEDNHICISNQRIPVSDKYREAFFALVSRNTL